MSPDPLDDPEDLADLDHERFIRRAYELAREAADRGDEPFGSLLVRDGEVLMEERNAVNTERDLARHPELTLARRAAAELDPSTVSEAVMYTSTEPCPMCSGGIYLSGLRAVVYGVSGRTAADISGGGFVVPSPEVFEGGEEAVTVVGPVLREEGERIHRAYW